MKRTHIVALLACCAWPFVGARAQSDTIAKRDLALLQGEWSMLWGESDGQRFSGIMLTGSRRIAVGNETTVTISGALFMKATFTLNPSMQPKAIDYAVTGGATAGKTQLGIYRLSGDTVQFCFAEPGVVRPAEFVAPAGTQRMCSAWKRERK